VGQEGGHKGWIPPLIGRGGEPRSIPANRLGAQPARRAQEQQANRSRRRLGIRGDRVEDLVRGFPYLTDFAEETPISYRGDRLGATFIRQSSSKQPRPDVPGRPEEIIVARR
jgi:hypothetical protein